MLGAWMNGSGGIGHVRFAEAHCFQQFDDDISGFIFNDDISSIMRRICLPAQEGPAGPVQQISAIFLLKTAVFLLLPSFGSIGILEFKYFLSNWYQSIVVGPLAAENLKFQRALGAFEGSLLVVRGRKRWPERRWKCWKANSDN
ncbi:hypothetical protein IEQ34_001971 [Dendrobium chrysotoxum]|uniref:EF-hand domain-containing protein n=1 Tax=Dendrobium chrysotoxum TaxID=161865 RepID=A0AAV7HLZ4_DENCH|nr:hypothetical protein IEQ34_001971 [Dendrobium chrysotoxum]